MFSLNNLNIQYPHALVERVPVGWNIFYSGAVPLLTLIVWLGLSKANLHKFHVTLLGIFISYVERSDRFEIQLLIDASVAFPSRSS